MVSLRRSVSIHQQRTSLFKKQERSPITGLHHQQEKRQNTHEGGESHLFGLVTGGTAGNPRNIYTIAAMPKVRIDGSWPGQVVLCRGWARAESRPWNDVVPMAHLRLVRGGGPSFIGACYETLLDLGTSAVLSPPLPRSARTAWEVAGFDLYADLTLMRRTLDHTPPPSHLVLTGDSDDIQEVLRIEAVAFDEFWRFDACVLNEAMAATSSSVLHIVRNSEGGLAGFAVTGVGQTIAYLQRLAVDPKWQGQGIGRSLVRTSGRWAKKSGAGSIMLNTQVDNVSAIGLYETEGFQLLEEPLAVLSRAS